MVLSIVRSADRGMTEHLTRQRVILGDVTNPEVGPAWLTEGASVKHETFGTGIVGHVGEYKGDPTVWVDFDYGERKALSIEYGLPFLKARGRWARRTPTNPAIRCDVCGSRPVTVHVDDQQFCDAHKGSYQQGR